MPENYRRPHNHERRQTVEDMKLAWAAERQALATVRRFNAANGKAWFWPQDCRRARFKTSLVDYQL